MTLDVRDKQRIRWVRRWWILFAEDVDELDVFDDTVAAISKLQTRFQLGHHPTSGDVETKPSLGDPILDTFSVDDAMEEMHRRKLRLLKKCPICTKPVANRDNMFCSNACRKVAAKRPMVRAEKLVKTCARCGKPTKKFLKYCSDECRKIVARDRYFSRKRMEDNMSFLLGGHAS